MKYNYVKHFEHEMFSKCPWYWENKRRNRNANARMNRKVEVLFEKQGHLIILLAMAKRNIVALDMPDGINDWIAKATGIRKAFIDNIGGWFTVPMVELALYGTNLANLALAVLDVENEVKGAVAARTTLMNAVELDLEGALAYVQGLVNAKPLNANSIAVGANMHLVVRTKADKPAIEAIRRLTGEIELIVKAIGRNPSYIFEISTDGITYTFCKAIKKGRVTITGLTPLTKYWFRFAVIKPDGSLAWIYCIPIVAL